MLTTLPGCDEAARLAALKDYQVLDSEPEHLFDDFTTLASHICDVPISLISLVDHQRQWFKSKVGISVNETPREIAFCAHALAEPETVLLVEDATTDSRFATNPLVTGEPFIRFYAGAPLVTAAGHILGTLCVIDQKPRQLDGERIEALKILSRQVVAQLEARRNHQLLFETAEKLEQQRRETQLILDHVPDAIIHKDVRNCVLRVNRAFADSLKIEVADAEGRLLNEIYRDAGDDDAEDDSQIITSGKPDGTVRQVRLPNGEPRWLSTDKIPVMNSSGSVDSVVVMIRDITAQRLAEEVLREQQNALSKALSTLERQLFEQNERLRASRAEYRDLYDNSPDMHVSVDARTGRVVQCNQTLARVTGYTKDEIVNKHVFDLYDPGSHEAAKQAFQSFLETGRVSDAELQLRCKDGSNIDVSLNVSAVRDENGNIVRSRSVWRDITKQKKIATQLANHRNELAHMTRLHTMGEMAAGLAHELNQPLSAITNYARGCARRMEAGITADSDLRDVIREVVHESERASGIIESLRRLAAKRQPVQRELDLNEVVLSATRLCRAEALKNDIRIEHDLAADTPTVLADSVQVEQVIVCLLLNAIEATTVQRNAERKIRVKTRRLETQHVEVVVQDSGPGIATDDPDQLYEPFFTTKQSGIGMGLAISRSIVESHGGRIWTPPAKSGASFHFCLPISQRNHND